MTLVDEMRAKLTPLHKVQETLAEYEPLGELAFTVGDQVRFDVANAWEFGVVAKGLQDMVDVWVTVGGGRGKRELRLTKEALLQFTSYAGMPHKYVEKLPAQLLGPSLNYWFREGLVDRSGSRTKDFKILTSRGDGVALTRQSVDPFSTLTIIDRVLAAVEAKHGETEVLVDPKFYHSLMQTWVRLVLPGVSRTIEGTSVAEDEWSTGIVIKNSLNGRGKTGVDGYLFRWVCSNGAVDVRNPYGGNWVRKQHVPNDGVYDWVQETAGNVLDNIGTSLDAVQAMVEVPIEGNVADTLKDIFQYYKVRVTDRPKIIELLSHAQRLTMYEVMQAITQVANDPANEQQFIESLQRLGGELPHASTSVCDACRRLSHVH